MKSLGVLQFEFYVVKGGATNRDMSLTKTCKCSQLYGKSSVIANLQTLESSNYFQGFHNGVKRINVDSLFHLNFSDQAAWVYFVELSVTIYNIEYF